MKKPLVLISISMIAFIFIAATCLKKITEKNKIVSVEKVSKHAPPQQFPKNWPWRGACVESKKTRPADINYLASVNVNFVQIMLKPDKRTKRENGTDPTKTFYSEIAWADSIMDLLKKNNMTCVLTFNNLVLDPKDPVDDKSNIFWDTKLYQDSAIAMVDILAKHFQNRGDEFSCYEIIGEPNIAVNGINVAPQGIEEFFARTLNTIRKYDQKRYFLLSPGPWAHPTSYANFEGYKSIKDPKIIYGAHMYLPHPYTHQGVRKNPRGGVYPGHLQGEDWDKKLIEKKMSQLKQFEREHGVLIYMGEFQSVRWADGANVWIKDVVDVLEANGWSWSIYAFQCDTDFWDPYNVVANPNDDVEKRTLTYKGKDSEEWQLMLGYYKRNAK